MAQKLLLSNKENGIRYYHAGLKINQSLPSGIWTFRLIYGEDILSEDQIEFKILKNSYGQSSAYYSNQNNIKVDIKY